MEALAILYCSHPLKTEELLNEINGRYLEDGSTEKPYRLLNLKHRLRNATESTLTRLCEARLNEKEQTIADFVQSKKNTWLFGDLASNILLSYPEFTERFVTWGNNSFLANVETYEKDPRKFVNRTITDVISILDGKPELVVKR